MTQADTPRDNDNTTAGKRPYRTPELTEYGSVAKLTQGAFTTQNECGGGMKMGCL
jgi:hypothetical protein